MPPILPLIVVVLSGFAIAVQAPLNASLGKALGATLPAATVSFGVGFIVLLGLSFVTGTATYARLPSVPLGLWTGGLLGAFYVTAVIWGVPILGALTTVAALILGQLLGALVVDSLGAFGLVVQEITPKRLAAAALVAAGLVLSRL